MFELILRKVLLFTRQGKPQTVPNLLVIDQAVHLKLVDPDFVAKIQLQNSELVMLPFLSKVEED
jgi:hypothetical protein